MTKKKLYQDTINYYQEDEYKDWQLEMTAREKLGNRLAGLLIALGLTLALAANMDLSSWLQ